ncbi:Ig-like domain-containing protein [Sphingomonas carotinifaciens]|uniref:Ig-like domain-containing protein n=1 Tax=Sphingomonas carotinifaciens TaxID=1166323 RepID=UPI000DD7AC66|nr:Ig-like domain-containing protein [Sphingomonas carotinifaciens]
MSIQAKITPANTPVSTGAEQTVTGSVTVQPGDNVALAVNAQDVASLTRDGADLVLTLKDGQTVRVVNFYAAADKPSHLYLLDGEQELVLAELSPAAADGTVAAAYVPQGVAADFASLGAAGAAAAGGGGGLGIAGILGGLALAGGGIAALSSGGDDDDRGGSTPPPPVADTTPPTAATGLSFNAAGTQLTGQAEAGATVLIDVNADGTADFTVTAGADGRFTATLSPAVADGRTVSVTVRDTAGNVGPAATVASPDTTPPASAQGVTLSPDGTTVTGTTEPGATVQIDIDGDGIPDITGVAGADGRFIIDLPTPLTDGEMVMVTVQDPAGNIAPPVMVAAPDVTAPEPATGLVIADGGTSVSGQAEPDAIVSVDTNGDGVADATGTAGPDGTFVVPLVPALTSGETVTVTVTDAAGNVGAPATVVAADTTAPAAATGLVIAEGGASISGSAEAGASVSVDTNGDGVADATGTAGADGTFVIALVPALTNGETVTVTVTDAAGNVGAPATVVAADTTAPAAATGLVIAEGGTSISGSAEAGAAVSVDTNGDGVADATGTVGADGTFVIALVPALTNGETVTVTVTDAAGNLGAPATVVAADTTAPAAATGLVIAADGASLSGVAEAGATVGIDIDGDGVADRTAVAADDGSFTVPLSPALLDAQVVSVVVTDAAGNSSVPATVTAPDTIAIPPAPTIDPTNGTVVTGTSQPGYAILILVDETGATIGTAPVRADGTWSLTPATPLADSTVVRAYATNGQGERGPAAAVVVDAVAPDVPTVAVSDGTAFAGTAEAGATITLSDAAGTVIGTTTAGADGAWALTPAAPVGDGVAVSVVARDASGNVSAPAGVTVDAAAPAAPVIAPSNGTVLTGTAEIGSTVVATGPDGTVIGSDVVGADGQWSVVPTAPLVDGTTVRVEARDAAGNVSDAGTTTVDAVAPGAPVTVPSNGTVVSGTAEPGATVTLTTRDGTVIGTGTAGADGGFAVTPTAPLADGTIVLVAASDAAGNAGPASAVRVDAAAPVAPVLDPTNGTAITGTAEAGATVSVTDGTGASLGQVVAGADGSFAITPAAPIGDGAVLTVVATDAAGNAGPAAVVTVDAVPPAVPVLEPSNGAVLSGTAEPGSSVTLSAGGVALGQVTADDDGNFQLVVTPPVADDAVVSVVATDAAGNASAPATLVIDASLPSTPVIAPTNGTVVTGTADAGTTVTVTDAAGATIGSTVVDASGTWSVTPAAPLGDGTGLSAVATNGVGSVSGTGRATVDAVAPDAPVLAASDGTVVAGLAEAGAAISVRDAAGVEIGTGVADGTGAFSVTLAAPLADGAAVVVVATDAAGNASAPGGVTVDAVAPGVPVIDAGNGVVVTGSAEAGALVTLTDAAGTVLGSAVVQADGRWQIAPGVPLGDGAVVNAVATDAAGNASAPATAVIDAVAPGAPVIAQSNAAVVAGTAEAGATVVVSAGGAVIGQTVAAADGSWSVAATLGDGAVVRAVAIDAAGNRSTPAAATVDAVAPGVTIAPSAGVTFAGVTEAGASVTVTAAGGAVLGTVTAGADGRWVLSAGAAVADGTAVSAVATDAAGNASAPASTVVDAVAPGAPVIAPSTGAVLTGTAEAGSLVTVLNAAGATIGTVQAGADGRWRIVPGTPVADGTVLSATATDAAGNVSAAGQGIVDATVPVTPVIDPSAGAIVTGTAEAGTTLVLTDGATGAVIGSVVVGADGRWSITPGTTLANATPLAAVSTDAAGNPSVAGVNIVDSVAPDAPVVAPSNGSVLAGTAEAGATITISDASGVIATTVADAGGAWAVTPGVIPGDGTALSITARDAAGNVSTPTTIVIDAVAPAAPVIDPSNGQTIAGSAEIGATVAVTDAAGNPIGSAVVGADGRWVVTPGAPLADGTGIVATVSDAAGNTSGPAGVTVDAIAPAVPAVNPSNGAILTGTAEPLSSVVLTDGAGGTIGTATVDADGNWQFGPIPALADGTQVRAVAVDAAGNSSGAATVTVDAVAPNVPTVVAGNGTLLTGTGELGATITLTEQGGAPIGTTVVGADGSWSFRPTTPLVDGTVVNAVASDAAGNASGPASSVVDAVAPPLPDIDPSRGVAITGTAEAGATVELRDANGVLIDRVTVDGNGNWTSTPATPLPDGQVVRAVAIDAAGNISDVASVTIDAVAPPAPVIDPTRGTIVTGRGEPGTVVTVVDGSGTPVGTATVQADGSWALAPAATLANGTTLSATARDIAGNVSDAGLGVVDQIAPDAPIIAATNGVSVTGTAEVGALVSLTDAQGQPIGTPVTADIDGRWTVTPAQPLADGTVVVARATDAAGNVSGPAGVLVDALPPATPTIDPSNATTIRGSGEIGSIVTVTAGGVSVGTATVGADGRWTLTATTSLADLTTIEASARDAVGNVSGIATGVIDAAAPSAPSVNPSNGTVVSGIAEAGATVTITLGGVPVATAVADANGAYSARPTTPIGNGLAVAVTATDAAGNVSGPGSVTIDASLPATPTIAPTNGVTITGTADVGTQVTVSANGTVLGTVQTDATGVWTLPTGAPLPDGTSLSAVATNAANTPSGTGLGIVDALAPAVPDIAPSNGTILSGTTEAGALVTLTVGGVPLGTTTAGADGRWQFTPGTAPTNGAVVSVTATDAAGNTGAAASVTIDALPPGVPTIRPSNGTALIGTAEAGSTVTLTAGGAPLATVVADSAGNWRFVPGTALANGVAVTAQAQDAAGNIGPVATALVDSVAPAVPTGLAISAGGTVLTGLAEPGAQVQVTVRGSTTPIIAPAAADGTFSVTLPVPLVDGQLVSVVAIDAAQNVGNPATVIAPDLGVPVVSVIEAADGFVNNVEARSGGGIQVAVGLTPGATAGDTVLVTLTSQNGYVVQTTATLTAADVAARSVGVTVPVIGNAADGPAQVTAQIDGGLVSPPATFVIDTIAPQTPVLSLVGNLLSVSGEPNSIVTVDVSALGTTATATVQLDNRGLGSLDLIGGLNVGLSLADLLDASVSARATDRAGNVSNIAALGLEDALTGDLLTVGGIRLNTSLIPLSIGLVAQTEPGTTVRLEVVTPAATVRLAPPVDANGNFGLNLLDLNLLGQLGLSVFGLLNLGAGLSVNIIATDQFGNDSARYGVSLLGNGSLLSLGEISVNGTDGSDVLTGVTGTSEVFYGGAGADLILGVHTGDAVFAGAGDDSIQLTATNFRSVDGGAGFDTLLLSNGIDLDYGPGTSGTIANIERIDLGHGDGSSVLTLTAAEVNAVTSTGNTLQITGDAEDRLVVRGATDTGTDVTIQGTVYDVYSFNGTTLHVEQNTVTVVV